MSFWSFQCDTGRESEIVCSFASTWSVGRHDSCLLTFFYFGANLAISLLMKLSFQGTQGAVWWLYTGWQCVLYFSHSCNLCQTHTTQFCLYSFNKLLLLLAVLNSVCLCAVRMLSWERSGVQLHIPSPPQSTVMSCWWVNSMKGLFVLVERITAPSSVLDTGSGAGAGAGRIIIFLPGFSVLSISGAVREEDVVVSDWRRHLFMKRWRQAGNTALTLLGVVIIVGIFRTLLRFLYDRSEIISSKQILKHVC